MPSGVSIVTEDGSFTAFFSERGLAWLEFPGNAAGSSTRAVGRQGIGRTKSEWRELTAKALHEALAGRKPRALPPLDWSGHTEFQQRVWSALLQIDPGQTRTYGQLAADLGNPFAARATGAACGANPIPVLVPCHRVVTANGGLGGYSGGLDWKRRLLALESRE